MTVIQALNSLHFPSNHVRWLTQIGLFILSASIEATIDPIRHIIIAATLKMVKRRVPAAKLIPPRNHFTRYLIIPQPRARFSDEIKRETLKRQHRSISNIALFSSGGKRGERNVVEGLATVSIVGLAIFTRQLLSRLAPWTRLDTY